MSWIEEGLQESVISFCHAASSITLFLKYINAPLNMFYVIEICYVRYFGKHERVWTRKNPQNCDIALIMHNIK